MLAPEQLPGASEEIIADDQRTGETPNPLRAATGNWGVFVLAVEDPAWQRKPLEWEQRTDGVEGWHSEGVSSLVLGND